MSAPMLCAVLVLSVPDVHCTGRFGACTLCSRASACVLHFSRSYRTSGTLDLRYLRFLWLHRKIDGKAEQQLNLSDEELDGVVATMEKLLVLYRAHDTDMKRTRFVVPARLPQYGDEGLLENGGIGLGDYLVRTHCTFRQSYAPPGIIGRFLAYAADNIKEAKECWQHGAHLIWSPGNHDVLLCEAHFAEKRSKDSVSYPGLVICVKGNTNAARDALDMLKKKVGSMLSDEARGYPGLRPPVYEGTTTVRVSDVVERLSLYLDNRLDRLESTVKKIAGVTNSILEGMYLASRKKNKYPRLFILKPEREEVVVTGEPPQGRMVNETAEGMQHETWDKWIKGWQIHKKFRLVFLCEHDLTEVECGPDGRGYPVEQLSLWVQRCIPLIQVRPRLTRTFRSSEL